MKKDIIKGSIFLLVIVLVVSLCSCSVQLEGLTASTGTQSTIKLPNNTSGLGTITSTNKLTTANVLFSTGIPSVTNPTGNDINSVFCAFIDGPSLKIAKRTGAVESTTPSTWTVIWDSSIAGYTGSELKMVGNVLSLGSMQLGVGVGASTGSYAKLTIEGDLLICDDKNVAVWSLIASQLSSITAKTNSYLNRGARTYRSLDIENLNAILDNFDSYINNINLTDNSLLITYNTLKSIRSKMDFDIQELNGLSNSKINTSKEMLQSGMYLNLGIAVLVASVFILISTR